MSPISEERIQGWVVGALAFLFSFGAIGAIALPAARFFWHVLGHSRFAFWLLLSGLVSIAIYLGWAKKRGYFNMMLRVIVTAWLSSVALYWLFFSPSLLKMLQAGLWHVLPISFIFPSHMIPIVGGVIALTLTLAVLKLYELWRKGSGREQA